MALLATLVDEYQPRLLRFLIFFLGAREGVDDLLQETWLRVLERGTTFDGRQRFAPWLFAIARHLALDQMRRRRTVSLGSGADGAEEWTAPDVVSAGLSPFAEAARTEDASRLSRALEELEPVYREAVLLRFQEELSLAEIAAVVGAPVSTVASRIYRGLAAMRMEMETVNL